MRSSSKKFTLAAATAVAALVAIPAGPAFAIDQVACGNRTDFAKLDIRVGQNLGTNRCFANSGVVAVEVPNVYRASSGNNKLTVNYQSGSQYYTRTLTPGTHINFASVVRVYEVRIW
ncbi:hypothetical protein KCV87_16870 [Actinosynnema pretiosum subsp. pretiosum]|uniref:Streptomyces killer toxin-like beta/gamma crystallin domain-containing protein n=2 Tax=Actinosynnema TaxID=40566 RepID=C6WKU9_ACTMD|nr:beta/gamma crystallin domain-containing protein [Actinosynnema mirum]ACU34704.1 hypothetical protein Amir_0741 [Actinosynnema mirum DSM 43827]AXX28063.1 hypothetical protein APASM_0698 [Actinosynnema pretiosum subsp. pretiosum]QUF07536.1 hypothetical protein KCV87_16870 [Actinosynnema pretiosum subsp. pretiosum]